jgi:hypothetical protein
LSVLLRRRAGRRRPATFSPDQVANLAGWYKADAITGLTNGAAVATWPDSSSNNLTGTQGNVAARPAYQASMVNGKPVVRFDGVNDLIESGMSASPANSTTFAVLRPTSTSGAFTIRGSFSGSSTGGLQYRVNNGKQLLIKQFVAQIGSPSATTLSTTNFSVVAVTLATGASGSYAFYLNGTADGSGSTTETLVAGMTTLIGMGQGGTNEPFSGDIAELICYSSVLSAADRNSVTAYLGTKYGISVA